MKRPNRDRRPSPSDLDPDGICAHAVWRVVADTDGGDYQRCGDCGLEEQVALASLEDRFVGAQDEWYGGDELACLSPFAMELSASDARYRVNILRTLAPPGRLLEIGPGAGHFAEAAQVLGYDVVAIEDSAILADRVRERGVTVIEDRFESAAPGSALFDIIVNWHVIEHVLDPCEFLSQAATFAAPNATLIVGTPNAASWQHRLARRRSPNYCLPHLRLFTAQSLADVFRASGWDPVESFTTDEPDHWLKFAAAHVRAIRNRTDDAPATTTAPPALSVTTIDARRGMQAIRAAGVVSWLPRKVQTRVGWGNELVAVGRLS